MNANDLIKYVVRNNPQAVSYNLAALGITSSSYQLRGYEDFQQIMSALNTQSIIQAVEILVAVLDVPVNQDGQNAADLNQLVSYYGTDIKSLVRSASSSQLGGTYVNPSPSTQMLDAGNPVLTEPDIIQNATKMSATQQWVMFFAAIGFLFLCVVVLGIFSKITKSIFS